MVKNVIWVPHEMTVGHPQDFDVKYRLYSYEEGGRKNPPRQGYRCDFSYDGDDITKTGIYMIHPEFEDEQGEIILDREMPIALDGTARMWIVIPEMREAVHRHRIQVGVKGYFMEGSRKVGEVEVIKVVGLFTNPVK